ncbi:MAG: sensor histidine kinase, partial [Lachnospiraceae bacterium]|nr:sensor histidine kinase [Lachnospiraceae bacterium]
IDDSMDLKLMVEGIIQEYENISISFDYDVDGELPKNLKYCFVSIIKEALTNVVKHSNASDVNITIMEHPALYQLLIFDNGDIEPDTHSEGIGLENMRERVQSFNGNIRFTFDNGFKIFVSIKKQQ